MGELHKQRFITSSDNARLMLSLYIQWFAFFWTLNGAALAWLYSGSSHPPHVGQVLLSILFVFLNVLAVAACWYFWVATYRLMKDAEAAQKEWSETIKTTGSIDPLPATTGLIPNAFLQFGFPGGMATFIANIVAWGILPFLTHASP